MTFVSVHNLKRVAVATVLSSLVAVTPAWAVVGVEEIAQALVQTRKDGDPNYTGGMPNDKITDIQFVMRVQASLLPSIEKYGFLNQFQTKTTNGSFSHSSRSRAESAMAEMSLSIEPKALRPKYGTVHMDRADGVSLGYDSSQYGNVIFAFGRHLYPRLTWSPGDSLGGSHLVRPLTSKASLPVSTTRYPEGQVWGDLDLSDVEMVVVDDSSGVDPVLKAVLEFSERNGLDVYRFKGSVGNNSFVLRPENMELLAKNSDKRQVYGSRFLHTTETLKSELSVTKEVTGPLLSWLAAVCPESVPVASCIRKVAWGDVFGAKSEYDSDPSREYREARENTVQGLLHMYGQAAGRAPLKAAIVRYLMRESWISDSDRGLVAAKLNGDSDRAEVEKWIQIWHERSSKLDSGDVGFKETVATEVKRIEHAPDTSATDRALDALRVIDSTKVIGSISSTAGDEHVKSAPAPSAEEVERAVSEIKKLAKELRHGDSEELRRLALGALAEILKKKELHEPIAKAIVGHSRFAHVVYRHAAEIDREFLELYLKAIEELSEKSEAHGRAIESCTELLKI